MSLVLQYRGTPYQVTATADTVTGLPGELPGFRRAGIEWLLTQTVQNTTHEGDPA
ncbi:hypothetical protein [Parenemella sanctibonifatiensis]|uniref:hypothetical protein n=1 Tax=Parenemella sanctibonifatiensis TaxID=2016505 RepID=UPI0015C616A5|nr:hypothetical protein [Parenemella sanctibonifatiensis]